MKTQGRQGFTVLELIVTLALGLVLIAAAYAIYLSQHRGFEKIEESTNVIQTVRMAVEQLTRELHMAGFGVVTGETITEAKKYSTTFLGDFDTDVDTVLSAAANIGDTTIRVDLRDDRDTIGSGDYIFVNGGGFVEMIKVRQSGAAVDLSGEPDTIYLNAPLTHAYTAGSTLIRTIEQVRYNVTFPAGSLTRNDVKLVSGLKDFEFHYFRGNGQEMVPDAVNGLTQIQRASVRRVELRFAAGRAGGVSRTLVEPIELRNMGNRPFEADTCKPAAPLNLQVTKSDTCEQFTVAWTPPTTNACDGSPLTDLGGYKIYYGTASGDYYIPPVVVADDTLTSFDVVDHRLNNNQTYYLTIRAYDRSWNESSNAGEITFQIQDSRPPAAPTELDATAGAGQVTLTWEKSVDTDVRGYRLYRGTSAGFVANEGTRIADENTLDTEITTFTDTGLNPCVVYYYKVSAVDCANEGPTSPDTYGDGPGGTADVPIAGVTNTTPTESPARPPSPPNPFQAVARSQAVDLAWTNPADADLAGVLVRYSTSTFPSGVQDGIALGTYPGSPGQSFQQTHSNLVNGTTYFYSAWAYDRCGNYSSRVTARATPGAIGPVVSIISPADGATITNNQLIFQARGYDPDQAGLHIPPSVTLDNGAGIVSMRFEVSPSSAWMNFPHMEYIREYCGFGGEANPCPTGDISAWCDGTYQLYVTATDDEGNSTVSPYVTITVHNGGIYLDSTVTPAALGTYRNEVTFQLKNDAAVSAKILTLQPTWNISDARLESIQIPDGTTIWSNTASPARSGDLITIASGSQPTVAGNGARSVRFVFTRSFTTLTSAAAAGAKTIVPASTAGFAVGDTIYLNDTVAGYTEAAVIDAISGGQFTLHSALVHSYSANVTYVRHTAVAHDISMNSSTINLLVTYQKTGSTASCTAPQITMTFLTGPEITNAQQDLPATNTPCSTTLAYLRVLDYRAVPMHVQVVDHAGGGISSTYLYYYVDHSFLATAPAAGYGRLTMTYSATNSRWEATVPYQTNARVWFYFLTTDGSGAQDRDPTLAAYSYDYIPDTTAPGCPLALTATMIGMKQINLSWMASPETDIRGYNIYRSADCGTYSRVYSLVQDQDPDTAGVQYVDNDNRLNASKYCYTYYITAVDMSGNESGPCQTYIASAGACPCN